MTEERTIRINKVLRELNISLERAVDYLKDNGINIDANPNAKISEHEFNVLANHFSNNKGLYKNMIPKKPDIILLLEKERNLSLKSSAYQTCKKNEFFLNEKDEVTGLNLIHNELDDINFLELFVHLKYLNLSHNKIKDIKFLKDLVYLEVLLLADNLINDISFFNKLINLKKVNLSLNNISDIYVFNDLKQIEQIDVSNNFITDLLQFNFILDLTNLYLRINNNPYFSLNNIVLKSNENHYDIVTNELNKLDDLQISALLPEKIILLGNHACGKSSFLYYLQNNELDYNHDTTHVLKIEKYPKNYKKLPIAIVYDFGGQDFYHGIYQTFLRSNCTTLLFWNTKTNKNIILPTGDVKQRPNRNFNTKYWLGQKKYKEISGQILLIQTRADDEDSSRYSYINLHKEISSEFYISLKKESKTDIKNKLKHASLNYLKEYLNDVILKNQKEKNIKGKMSKPYFEFVKYILENTNGYTSISKDELKNKYKIDSKERYEVDIEQLKRQGLILEHKNNVWLDPVALTEYVHKNILREDIIGNGIIEEEAFKKLKFDNNIVELLLEEKVIFFHEFGLSSENKIQKEFIIPNYLPQISSSGIDYDLMIFGLDNPLFILKFNDYLPFGLINQLICYFGRLPDQKKFWREHLIFTIDKKAKVLIELDFQSLKIKVYSVYSNEVDISYKNDIEKYLFYIIMAMYWNFEVLPISLKEFREIYQQVEYESIESREYFFSDILMNEFYNSPNCHPRDLYISKDDNVYIKFKTLCNVLNNETTIQTYVLNKKGEVKSFKSNPISLYQNFTHKKLKKMKKVFISYSHDDLDYRRQLQTYLVNLERENKIEIWHDGLIDPGDGWNEKIVEKLRESDIIILLISQTFISSKYIHEVEMRNSLQQKLRGDSKIIPILVSNCDWNNWNIFLGQESVLSAEEINEGRINNYQLMPMNDSQQRLEAINRWKYPEDAWTKIIGKIRQYADLEV